MQCERAAKRGTRYCTVHTVLLKLPDYQKDEQLSTYKFSIGERVNARYSDGTTVQGTIKSYKDGWSRLSGRIGLAYTVQPDTTPYPQLFWEHELTKVSQPEESPYTNAIDAVDAEILKHEQHITEIRKKIASLNRARTTLTDLRRAEA